MASGKRPTKGSTRKTSNGCAVAQRVPRRDARCSCNVAAIDFGTANCSLAYLIGGDRCPNLLTFHGVLYRVPTTILFRRDGTVEAFGYTARETYHNLEDEEQLEWAYFEQIKTDLKQDESVNREMKVKAKNGNEYYLVEVIAHILKYLKDELIRKLQHAGYQLEATDFDWVITVPAIWRARGRQMMREAGYKAGLCSQESCTKLQPASHSPEPPNEQHPEKLSLELELEAAVIFCQTMSRDQLAQHCRAREPFTASSYLIIDIGIERVNVSAYHVMERTQRHISVLHPVTGKDYGGTKINEEFRDFLQRLVQDKEFKRFLCYDKAQNQAVLNDLQNRTFEKQKILFGNKDDSMESGQLVIELPYEFYYTYRADLQEGIRNIGGSQIQLRRQKLSISYELMAKFFEPVRDGILECIAQTLEDVGEKVEKIYIVGEFECKYLSRAIEDRFGSGYQYIIPHEPANAVVRGAVLSHLYPNMMECRKADATYGIATSLTFTPGLHDSDYRYVNEDGEAECGSLFSTIVERGDLVGRGEVFESTLHPTSKNQTSMEVVFYSSMEKDVWYVTGRRGKGSHLKEPVKVNEIGRIVIEMPDVTGGKSRAVDVTFDFTHTEIQVQAFDRTSKNKTSTVLDFLTGLDHRHRNQGGTGGMCPPTFR